VEAHVRYQHTEFADIRAGISDEAYEMWQSGRHRISHGEFREMSSDAYSQAWFEVQDQIAKVMARWMAAPGADEAPLRDEALRIISLSMANNR
jgi:hypothetical protein